MNQDPLKTIHLRNAFYRDNYRKLVFILTLGFIAIVILAAGLLYSLTHPPEPRYFAVSQEGRIIPLVPLKEPNLSNAALLQWATQASVAAFSYNYVNYREAIQASRDNFTDKGWQTFASAFNASNNLSAVIAKKLIVSAVPIGVPVIIEQGLKYGVYAWRVQIPLLVTYQSPSDLISDKFRVDLLIVRQSTLQSVRGIAIAQFVMVSGSGRN